MAELLPQEKLQPALLDRLTDDEPDQKQESRLQRILSLTRLRECVLRDLRWLLNTGSLSQLESLEGYPHAARSVLNYGLPDLAGVIVHRPDLPEIERQLRQAIVDFEPRILPKTLKVRAILDEDEMTPNALTFEIVGQLWAQPLPLHLFLKTSVDLETGTVSISEKAG
ncbi:MAG: type VI secretion system baseplate subunit TssE [Planctomycetes bacterium]|nr:type VI secretion system baseplate subunit TssE [Planctomycetota bacterium]